MRYRGAKNQSTAKLKSNNTRTATTTTTSTRLVAGREIKCQKMKRRNFRQQLCQLWHFASFAAIAAPHFKKNKNIQIDWLRRSRKKDNGRTDRKQFRNRRRKVSEEPKMCGHLCVREGAHWNSSVNILSLNFIKRSRLFVLRYNSFALEQCQHLKCCCWITHEQKTSQNFSVFHFQKMLLM